LKDRQHNGQKKKDRQHNGQKKKDRQHNGQKKKDRQHNGQKKKDRQHNGQKTEGQTTQWPKDRRTDNTMAKRKITKGQTTIYKTYIYN
jgi:TRAF3-interacting protein 1